MVPDEGRVVREKNKNLARVTAALPGKIGELKTRRRGGWWFGLLSNSLKSPAGIWWKLAGKYPAGALFLPGRVNCLDIKNPARAGLVMENSVGALLLPYRILVVRAFPRGGSFGISYGSSASAFFEILI